MDRKKRVDMAQERALERMDYVLDYYAAPDFVLCSGIFDFGEELIAWRGMGIGCYASSELTIRQFCCV